MRKRHADKRAFPKNTERRPLSGARRQEQEATNEEVSKRGGLSEQHMREELQKKVAPEAKLA
jgi:hypothetical protein